MACKSAFNCYSGALPWRRVMGPKRLEISLFRCSGYFIGEQCGAGHVEKLRSVNGFGRPHTIGDFLELL